MTAEAEPLIFWDRSRANTDDVCNRARFYLTGYQGRGIVPARKPIYFDLGNVYHEAMDQVLGKGMDPLQAARAAEGKAYGIAIASWQEKLDRGLCLPEEPPVRAAETACVAGGLIAGFFKAVWPWVLEEYEVVATEQELTLDHAPGVRFGCRPDLILRRKRDGTYGYPDFKSTGDNTAFWAKQWETDVQLMSGARAIRESLHMDIKWVLVFGLYKGYLSKGSFYSNLAYGWRNDLGVGTVQYRGNRPDKWAGWKRFPVWEDLGYIDWIDKLAVEELAENFPMTRPIAVRDDLVDAWFAQRAIREREIAVATHLLSQGCDPAEQEAILNSAFRQNFKACNPRRGSPCAYADCCWLPHVGADPLKHGYSWREPHHSTDPMYQGGED